MTVKNPDEHIVEKMRDVRVERGVRDAEGERWTARASALTGQREHSFALLTFEDGAAGAPDAGGVYVLGMVLEVHESYLLRHPV